MTMKNGGNGAGNASSCGSWSTMTMTMHRRRPSLGWTPVKTIDVAFDDVRLKNGQRKVTVSLDPEEHCRVQ